MPRIKVEVSDDLMKRLTDRAIELWPSDGARAVPRLTLTTEVPAEFKTAPPTTEETRLEDQAEVIDDPAVDPVPDDDESWQDRAPESVPGEDAVGEPDSPSEPLQDDDAEQVDEDLADPVVQPQGDEEAEEDELYFGDPLTLADALA